MNNENDTVEDLEDLTVTIIPANSLTSGSIDSGSYLIWDSGTYTQPAYTNTIWTNTYSQPTDLPVVFKTDLESKEELLRRNLASNILPRAGDDVLIASKRYWVRTVLVDLDSDCVLVIVDPLG